MIFPAIGVITLLVIIVIIVLLLAVLGGTRSRW